MSNRNLSKSDRITVANAIQLIRDAGYDEKADLLDDMLQDGDIDIDQHMERGTYGYAVHAYFLGTDILLYEQISLNFRLFSPNWLDYPIGSKTPVQRPYTRKDPELFVLSSVLHHEADHVLGDDELACFGGEITFCKKLCKDMAYYFPKLTAAERAAMKKEIEDMKDEAESYRKDIAGKGGRSYGDGYRKAYPNRRSRARTHKIAETESGPVKIVRSPPVPTNPEMIFLNEVGEKILHFEENFGKLPKTLGELLGALDQLESSGVSRLPHPAEPQKRSGDGHIFDSYGNPLVYRVPGKIFPRRFDLYSLGECGEDRNGEAPNLLYLMNRR